MYKGIIKDFVVRGRVFHIVQDEEGFFLAVEDKYVTNGKLNTTLNGFQLHVSKCLKTCLQGVKEYGRNRLPPEYRKERRRGVLYRR